MPQINAKKNLKLCNWTLETEYNKKIIKIWIKPCSVIPHFDCLLVVICQCYNFGKIGGLGGRYAFESKSNRFSKSEHILKRLKISDFGILQWFTTMVFENGHYT